MLYNVKKSKSIILVLKEKVFLSGFGRGTLRLHKTVAYFGILQDYYGEKGCKIFLKNLNFAFNLRMYMFLLLLFYLFIWNVTKDKSHIFKTIGTNCFIRLKNKVENNSIWEGAFNKSKWVKISSSCIILVFSLYVCCCLCIWIVLHGLFSEFWMLFTPF